MLQLKPQIGYTERTRGQFGNFLFQYNLLLQLSWNFGFECFMKTEKYLLDINDSFLTKRNINSHINKVTLDRKILAEFDWDISSLVSEKIVKKGKSIILPTGIYGESFFTVTKINPNFFMQIPGIANNKLSNAVKVGIHVRGNDFKFWNEKATPDFEFYLRAINEIKVELGSEYQIEYRIFTDDHHSEIVEKLKKHFKLKIEKSSYFEDFIALSGMDFIVAPPSTFSIWAGILGKSKTVYFEKNWINYSLERKDRFWVELNENSNKYFKFKKI